RRHLQRVPPQSAGNQAEQRGLPAGTLYHRRAGSRGHGRLSRLGRQRYAGGPTAAAPNLGRGPGGRAGERSRQRPSGGGGGATPTQRGHGGRNQSSSSFRERGSGQSADRCRAGRRQRGWSAASGRGDTGAAEHRRKLRGIALALSAEAACAPNSASTEKAI